MTEMIEYRAEPEWLGMVACETGRPLTAAGIPVKPPKDWFADPGLDRLTPMTISADGRVYGHIASWESSHIGHLGKVRPPRSRSKYQYFRTGVVETDSGDMVPVGQITLTGGHAPLNASADEAVAHYDNTNSAIMDVAAGEDRHGIWVAGALRPDVDDLKIRAIRASSVSGDWRPINGSLELVAICAVNVPGFPIPRAMAAAGVVADEVDEQELLALVAAGSEPLVALAQRDPLLAAADNVLQDIETKMSWLRMAFTALDPEPVTAAFKVEEETLAEVPAEAVVEAAEEIVETSAAPENSSEEPVLEDDSDTPAESDSAEESEHEEDVELPVFLFSDDLSAEMLAHEVSESVAAETLWLDDLPLHFSTAQAEAVALRLRRRKAAVGVDPTLRARAAEEGVALPDGRLPLGTPEDIVKALQIVPEDSEYFAHIEARAEALETSLDLLKQDALVAAAVKQKYSQAERVQMAKAGEALPGGSFPIRDEEDLQNAIASYGRASDLASAKSHIMKRARALRRVDILPEKWSA